MTDMYNAVRRLLYVLVLFTPVVCQALELDGYNIQNLELLKKQIYTYFNSSTYHNDLSKLTCAVKNYLDNFQPTTARYAVIFDIDDTLLSLWPLYEASGLTYDEKFFETTIAQGILPAVPFMQDLYEFVKAKGFAIFLITGRPYSQHESTVKNLQREKFSAWDGIVFASKMPRTAYKAAARRWISDQGYTIVATIGDQCSDIVGPAAGKGFKVPNPLYFIS